MSYEAFFRKATGNPPYPFQQRLAEQPWPDLIDVPTGLGKTAAVALAWAYKLTQNPTTHRRLIWCLPMRVLVEQTADVIRAWFDTLAPEFADANLPIPRVQVLMGGHIDDTERNRPEWPTVIIGTQDMLLSRALMRGYAMSRYAWPMDFAWVNNDALWVFDETQAMGVAVETSAQLQAFRQIFGTSRPTHSIWMSATLGIGQLQTVDHPFETPQKFQLDVADEALPTVTKRLSAAKPITCANVFATGKATNYSADLAQEVLEQHVPGTLTLVILNRVQRAQDVYKELIKAGRSVDDTGLVHSRFRKSDRARQMSLLSKDGDRIIVSTQVIEAGVDVSARTLFSELAPWPSLVQRFGRCNRYGEQPEARVFWIDLKAEDEKDDLVLPYEFADFETARIGLEQVSSANPAHLAQFNYTAPNVIRPVIRRRDILELFDTTGDISGDDLDISPYIRDPSQPDVFVFWRALDDARPSPGTVSPIDDEVCRISIGAAKRFKATYWIFDPLEERWMRRRSNELVPGATYLIAQEDGGYADDIGFTGTKDKKHDLSVMAPESPQPKGIDNESRSKSGSWITLADHTDHVVESTKSLIAAIHEPESDWLVTAARWHDVGKAHFVFQEMLLKTGDAPSENIWAKSGGENRSRPPRPHFRHELASMLVYRANFSGDTRTAFVILAHHGKVRGSLRSLPGELAPEDVGQTFARGVWTGDVLPQANLGNGVISPETTLTMDLMTMGGDSWGQSMINLVEEHGIFRLAWWESILRCADQRASAVEAGNE